MCDLVTGWDVDDQGLCHCFFFYLTGGNYNSFQGQIQDFLRGGLNIEVISEAGGLGGTASQKLLGFLVM